jgi:hypothetical protein
MLKIEETNPRSCMQVKKDLNRTRPNCSFFHENGQGQKSLENVLVTYAKYDTQVGYIQGINFIVAVLLYHSSEEIAFWLFVSLMEDYEMREIYLPGLPGLYKHICYMQTIMQGKCKGLVECLVKLRVIGREIMM